MRADEQKTAMSRYIVASKSRLTGEAQPMAKEREAGWTKSQIQQHVVADLQSTKMLKGR